MHSPHAEPLINAPAQPGSRAVTGSIALKRWVKEPAPGVQRFHSLVV